VVAHIYSLASVISQILMDTLATFPMFSHIFHLVSEVSSASVSSDLKALYKSVIIIIIIIYYYWQ